MPKYKFRWDNLPDGLLKALCRDLGLYVVDDDHVGVLRTAYGVRPGEDLVRDAWPTLRDSWLRVSKDSRDLVVEELCAARREPAPHPAARDAQMDYLHGLRNAKNLREIVLDELITVGEADTATGPEGDAAETVPAQEAAERSAVPRENGATPHPSPPTVTETVGQRSSVTLSDLERRLWAAANALRGPVDPADFKTYVFPMLFWKWLSDNWDWEHRQALEDYGGDLNDEIEADFHQFALPAGTRWRQVTTKTDNIGSRIATALGLIEQANAKTLANIFGDAAWGNKERLPETALVNLMNAFNGLTLNPDQVSHDMLGQAYEYLLKNFADESGKKAGEFFTPRQVVHLLVRILDPQQGESVYDPAAGSGGMLVDTINSVRDRGGDTRTLRLYAQEVNLTTAAIARMNLYLHQIEDFKVVRGDTLRSPGLRNPDGTLSQFDIVIANPPFSLKNWGADTWAADPRSFCGVPPATNGDFAWVQHMVSSMDPTHGRVGVVMPHGVLFRGGVEARIRQCLIERDLLEAVIGLPANLFYSTSIPACLLIFRANKSSERRSHVLMVDGGTRFTRGRNQNHMSDEDIVALLNAYRSGDDPDGEGGAEVRLVPVDEIKAKGFDLNIGRYVKVAASEGLDLGTALANYLTARNARRRAEAALFARLEAAAILDLGSDDESVD